MSEFEEGAKAVASTMNAAEKMLEVVSDATGGIFKPKQMVRKAKATTKVIDLIAEASEKHPELLIKYEADGVVISNELSALTERTFNRLTTLEMIKQINIESIINQSFEELETQSVDNYDEVDKDWILKFFNSIENISDENMQKVWAKILSGKIKTPKNYTLRTIDVLSNLSKEDCEFISFVKQFVFQSGNDYYLYNNQEMLQKYGVDFDKLSYLQELNIIHSSQHTNIMFNTLKDTDMLINHNGYVIFCNKANETINIPVFTFTKVGVELLSLADVVLNNEFAMEMMKEICLSNKNLSCHKINSINGTLIDYDDKNIFED